MGTFWRQFIPYQLWRYHVLNTRMYLIARGLLGPR